MRGRTTEERLVAHIAQATAARAARIAVLSLGIAGALDKGLPALLAALAVWYFLGLAAPPPDPDLDRATGRH